MSKPKKNVQPNWRPNFVSQNALPDIKVIRTGFIINFISVLLMLLVGFYVLQREYRAYALSNTIAEMEQRINAAESENAANLKLSEKFRKLAAHVIEVEKFYASPVLPHELVSQISLMRPEDLIFNQLSLVEQVQTEGKAKTVTYRINISGEVRSLTTLDEFKGDLASWELLATEGYELDIDEALRGRDAETGIFPYTLQISLKPVKGKAAKKGGAK